MRNLQKPVIYAKKNYANCGPWSKMLVPTLITYPFTWSECWMCFMLQGTTEYLLQVVSRTVLLKAFRLLEILVKWRFSRSWGVWSSSFIVRFQVTLMLLVSRAPFECHDCRVHREIWSDYFPLWHLTAQAICGSHDSRPCW